MKNILKWRKKTVKHAGRWNNKNNGKSAVKNASGNVLSQPGTFWLKLVNSNTVPRRRRHREGVRCWDDLGRHAVS